MTSVVRYSYGYNRGTGVTGVTSHFLAGFKACFTGRNICLVPQSSPGPMVEPIILLKGHNIKLPSRFLSFYPQITAVLRYHQRSLSVQWVVGNTELVKGKRKVNVDCSVTNGTSISNPFFKLKDYCRRGREIARTREAREEQSQTVTSGHDRVTVLMNQ